VSGAEVNNTSGITSPPPYTFVAWCLGKEVVHLYIFRGEIVGIEEKLKTLVRIFGLWGQSLMLSSTINKRMNSCLTE
jgi:hypothetical protein